MFRIISEDGLTVVGIDTNHFNIRIVQSNYKPGTQVEVCGISVFSHRNWEITQEVLEYLNEEIYNHVINDCKITTANISEFVEKLSGNYDAVTLKELFDETLEHLGEVDA
jgi:hypothetical protein